MMEYLAIGVGQWQVAALALVTSHGITSIAKSLDANQIGGIKKS